MKRRFPGGKCLLIAWLILPALATTGTPLSDTFLEQHGASLDRLFSHLDPDHPQAGTIRRIWEGGDRREAATQLDDYFDRKSFPLDVLQDIAYPYNLRENANAALEHRFFLLDKWETVPSRPEGGIDWLDRGSRGDKERAWMLNRHRFLPELARVYKETGDPRFREQLNFLWRDWIVANPYPARLNFSAPWRALEVARRILISWVHVFYGDALMDPETRLLVLISLLDHGDALRNHASFWGGNHLITEKLALLTIAVAFPEFTDSAAWRQYAIERVSDELLKQSYPDGSYKELSNHYQRVILFNSQYFLQLLSITETSQSLEPTRVRIEKMWDFFARVMKPDGSGPLNNASDFETNDVLVLNVWKFFDRPDWRFIASRGNAGAPPQFTPSHLFPWAGQAILRNNWNRDADWVYFDAGPYGTAHQHVDRLHLSASLDGRPLLVDSGRYTYQPGIWKDYFQGPRGHNILLLDDLPAEQAARSVEHPLPILFQDTSQVSIAAAKSLFRAPLIKSLSPKKIKSLSPKISPKTKSLSLIMSRPAPWTRAVLLDKKHGFVLVADHLVTFGAHSVEAIWHFHPDVDEGAAGEALHQLNSGPSLSRTIVSGGQSPSIAGYYSPDYNQRLAAPAALFTGTIDRPTTLLWRLQAPGDPPIDLRVLSKAGAPVLEFEVLKAGQVIVRAALRLHPEPELIRYDVF